MNETFFADLHCHPSFKNFNRSALKDDYDNAEKYNLYTSGTWNDNSNKSTEDSGSMWSNYEQSHIKQCYTKDENGNANFTKLLFASLYPLEKGWVVGNKSEDVDEADILIEQQEKKESWLRRSANKLLKIVVKRTIYNDKGLRAFAQSLYMNLTNDRIRFFQGHFNNKIYDYYSDLFKEYDFIKRKNNKPVFADGKNYSYKIIENKDDLKTVMSTPDMIGLPITIEGAHVFSVDITKGKYDTVAIDEMLKRIKEIKEVIKPFFITICHHFDNKLCGHAHSFPDMLATFTDQVENMNGDINDTGKKVLRNILGLDTNNNPDASLKRTLIDIKHLSFRSRKTFYSEIIIPHNSNPANKTIPVISSHCAYSGLKRLIDFEINAPLNIYSLENQNRTITRNGVSTPLMMNTNFYKWNINLCDEDIKVITGSGGLIGITFDQRVLGNQDTNEEYIKNTFYREAKSGKISDEYWAQVILDNILFMAEAWINIPGQNDPLKIYNTLCIGSDFDGIIDPVNSYPTIPEFPKMKHNLEIRLNALSAEKKTNYHIDCPGGITSFDLIQKFCFDNTLEFLKRNLPD